MAGAVGVLVLIGLASIYVTDTHYIAANDGPRNAARQVLYVLAGLIAAGVVLRVGYQRIASHAWLIFGITVAALLPLAAAKFLHASFGGLTAPRNGAYRWIHLPGYQLQPSELFKVAFILTLAWYLRFRRNYRRFQGLLVPFLIAIVPLGLILVQPDLGTVLLLLPVLFAMLFAAGARLRHLAILIGLGLVAIPLAWGRLHDYQRLRVTSVLLQSDALRSAVAEQPERYRYLASRRQAIEWAASSGYQLVHSKNAVGSGGVLGQGWGEGLYVQQDLLPDRHNDFVFAIIAHQWGIVGGVIVLACYAVILLAGMRIASATDEPVGRLLAVGSVTLIGLQVLINVGMCVGLMPITGLTLPFVSYGGSSLLSSMLCLAMLVSVAQHRPFILADKPFDFEQVTVDRVKLTEKIAAAAEEEQRGRDRNIEEMRELGMLNPIARR